MSEHDHDPSAPLPAGQDAEAELTGETAQMAEADDPAKVEQAERMLREANLARVRGNITVADRLLKEAADLAPNTPSVLAALGDDMVARGQFRRAKEFFARAHKLDPSNAVIENKFGEMVLKVDLHIDPFAHNQEFDTFARPGILMFLSAILPGTGQMIVERYVKGGIMLAIFAACMAGIAMLPGGFKLIGTLFTGKGEFDPMAAILLGVSGIDALWSVVDLASLKKPHEKKIARPTPPVDGF